MTEIKNESGSGTIQIADEVIAVIAGTAALEIEGIVMTSGIDLAEIIGRKNLSKGVKIQVKEADVIVDIHLLVKFGYQIQEKAKEVQTRVKTAIETMTGLSVADVNIFVSGVQIEKENIKDLAPL